MASRLSFRGIQATFGLDLSNPPKFLNRFRRAPRYLAPSSLRRPNGRLRLRKSSGYPAYDEAVERAIWKSSPLPLPDRQEKFQRELTLKLTPQG